MRRNRKKEEIQRQGHVCLSDDIVLLQIVLGKPLLPTFMSMFANGWS